MPLEGDVADLLGAVLAAEEKGETAGAITKAARLISKAARCTLALMDQGDSRLVVLASEGAEALAPPGTPVPVTRTIVQSLRRSRPVHLAGGLRSGVSTAKSASKTDWRTKPITLMPMVFGERLLGALLLEFDSTRHDDPAASEALSFLLRQAATAIHRLSAFDELRRQVDELSSAVALHETLAHGFNLQETLGLAIERLKNTIGAEMAGAFLCDRERKELVAQPPAVGYGDGVAQLHLPIDGPSVSAIVFRTGRPCVVNDSRRDPITTKDFVDRWGIRNSATVPLDVNSNRIGVFTVVNKRAGTFGEDDLRLIGTLAKHLALVIHTSALLEGERTAQARVESLEGVIASQRQELQALRDQLKHNQRKQRDQFVDALVGDGISPEHLLQDAAYLEVDMSVPRAVLVIGVDDREAVERQGGSSTSLLMQLLDTLESACQRLAPGSVTATCGGDVIALIPVRTKTVTGREAELHNFADSLRAHVRHVLTGVTISIGIGRCCDTLPDYAFSYKEARRALDALVCGGHTDRAISFDELDLFDMLFDRQSHDKLMALIRDKLGPLIEYDRRHRTDLVKTLEQFFAQDCHLEHAAATLVIHVSTLRYRMQRIEDLLGIKLQNADAKFQLQLALRIARALGIMADA